ncbi:MAG TPA: hypothetical protein VGD45_03360 [Steroidobacter sp.]|uniref:hypothetical protein n=1 Tax=Steroidobacter sp. TaxID=1978227 RepID=UPI002ED85709
MKSIVSIVMISLLAAACAREQTNSDGNGPGNADGTAGRADPPTAPANDGRPATDSSEAPNANVDSATAPPPQPSQQ